MRYEQMINPVGDLEDHGHYFNPSSQHETQLGSKDSEKDSIFANIDSKYKSKWKRNKEYNRVVNKSEIKKFCKDGRLLDKIYFSKNKLARDALYQDF